MRIKIDMKSGNNYTFDIITDCKTVFNLFKRIRKKKVLNVSANNMDIVIVTKEIESVSKLKTGE